MSDNDETGNQTKGWKPSLFDSSLSLSSDKLGVDYKDSIKNGGGCNQIDPLRTDVYVLHSFTWKILINDKTNGPNAMLMRVTQTITNAFYV